MPENLHLELKLLFVQLVENVLGLLNKLMIIVILLPINILEDFTKHFITEFQPSGNILADELVVSVDDYCYTFTN
jgi:F0F1-type ATP synthase membrane subunit a